MDFEEKSAFVSFVPWWLISDSNLHRRPAESEISLMRRSTDPLRAAV
jgi:hypothetical protein